MITGNKNKTFVLFSVSGFLINKLIKNKNKTNSSKIWEIKIFYSSRDSFNPYKRIFPLYIILWKKVIYIYFIIFLIKTKYNNNKKFLKFRSN